MYSAQDEGVEKCVSSFSLFSTMKKPDVESALLYTQHMLRLFLVSQGTVVVWTKDHVHLRLVVVCFFFDSFSAV